MIITAGVKLRIEGQTYQIWFETERERDNFMAALGRLLVVERVDDHSGDAKEGSQ